jgi:hypothetical protein
MPPRWQSLAVAAVAAISGAAAAVAHRPDDPLAREVDGWAERVRDHYPNRMPAAELLRPSLWKGPVVPTAYHLAYVLVPSADAVLGLNVLAFAAAVGLFHRAVAAGGGHPLAALLAALGWAAAPGHRYLFGYYFAEPLVSLLGVTPFALLLARPGRPLVIGLAGGVLLLARPTFLLVLALVPVVWWTTAGGPARTRLGWAGRYAAGVLVVWLPWVVRNWLVLGAFVPFTVEGGQTLFHGSYLPVEEDRWQVLRELPEVKPLVDAAPADPVGRMRYFAGLARAQILADPAGQAVRCVRKGLKFWVYLPPGEWLPTWKTGLAAGAVLLLGGWAGWRHRRVPAVRWAAAWVVGLWAVHAAVFGAARYHFPVLPMALFLAASAFFPPPPPAGRV